MRTPMLLAFVGLGALGAVAVGLFTNGFGNDNAATGNSRETAAQERCQADVLDRMVDPSKVELSNVEVAPTALDPEVKDLFSLTINAPLKGVDHSRISVIGVSGDVVARSEVGSTIHQRFECRAYFVDDNLADTLVLLDHDESGHSE